jgi:hypothetical protein
MVCQSWAMVALASLSILGCGGGDRPPGRIEGERRTDEALANASRAQGVAAARLDTNAGAEQALPGSRRRILRTKTWLPRGKRAWPRASAP